MYNTMPQGPYALLAPRPGACPLCAAEHRPDAPHNRDSLYYQMRFRQKHGRWPSWADAMAHCSDAARAEARAALAAMGFTEEQIDGA